MTNEASDRDHVVVTVNIKKVEFVTPGGSIGRNLSAAAGAKQRLVGDLLQFSVSGTTVEAAVERAKVMMGVVDDETPATNLKHTAMREGE